MWKSLSLWDPMDYTVLGILQARILEWVAFPLSKGSSQPKGIEPRSPTLQVYSLPAEPQGKPKNTGVGSLSLLQRIFPTQELNWGLQHCRQILYQLSYQGSKTKGKDGLNIFKLQKVKRADNETSAKIELLCTLHRSSLRRKMIIIILDSSQGCCLLHIRQQMRRPFEKFRVLWHKELLSQTHLCSFCLPCFSAPRPINIPEAQNNLKNYR